MLLTFRVIMELCDTSIGFIKKKQHWKCHGCSWTVYIIVISSVKKAVLWSEIDDYLSAYGGSGALKVSHVQW